MTTAEAIAEFFVHPVTVETLDTEGPWGNTYADPVTVYGFADHSRRLVRDGAGAEVVSEAVLTTYARHGDLFRPGSRVDLGTRVAYVIQAAVAVAPGLDLPEHLEVALT